MALEGWCPAQFDSFPPQTQPSVFEQGNDQTLLDISSPEVTPGVH